VDGGADVDGVGSTDVLVDGGVVVVDDAGVDDAGVVDAGVDETGAAEVVGEFAGRVTGGTTGIVVIADCCVGSAAASSLANVSAAPSASEGSTTVVDAGAGDTRSTELGVVSTPASLTASLVTDSDRATVELLAAVASTDPVAELTRPVAGPLVVSASRDV